MSKTNGIVDDSFIEYHKAFDKEYAISRDKDIGANQYYAITGSQYEAEIITFLNSLNEKPILNIDRVESLISSIKKVPPVLEDCSVEFSKINEEVNSIPQGESNTSIFNYDFYFGQQLSSINGFQGFLNRVYFPTYNKINLINLGYKITGRINVADTYTDLYKGGIKLPDPISCKGSEKVSLVPISDYIEQLDKGGSRIYQYENFHSDFSFWYFSTNEWREDLEEVKGVVIDDITTDYFFIEDQNVFVPVLRNNAHYEGRKGRVDFTFWSWALDDN